mmetsp:Transcript_7599/g.11310  ORF Transcript_7599/g.11310 Transcript_7599/m.11310 type:complete len:239 (-) Transcript_7599:234-950(-)
MASAGAAFVANAPQPQAWVSLCGNIAPIASMVVVMAPIPTIKEISQRRDTMNLPLLPYSSMFVNAFMWSAYGLMKNESKVWMTNMFGMVCATYYLQKFVQFVPTGATNLPGSVQMHIKGGALAITGTILPIIFCSNAKASKLVGSGAVVLCLILFASPLSALKRVIATKSAASIPLPFTLACVVNCFCWAVFGLFQMKDVMIYAPNLLGLLFGFAQLFLIMLFGSNGPRTRNENAFEV